MSDAKPSPGPWESTDIGRLFDGPGPSCIRIVDANGDRVADVLPHSSVGGKGLAVARANVALIIAASKPKETK
jgi:hypothetical protein